MTGSITVLVMAFSNREYAEMHFVYGFCNGNALAAQREYRDRYPQRTVPSTQVFTRLHQRLIDTGRVEKKKREEGKRYPVEAEVQVLHAVEENPGSSTRQIASESGMSQWKVRDILKENKFHPYHFITVQALENGDFEARQNFCRWLLMRDIEEYHFLRKILWTDEAHFTREGVFNSHNSHLWKMANPRATREKSFQRRFSINVWAGVIGDQFLGPHIFAGNLNGEMYLDFLQHNLPQLLDGIDTERREELIFQQDGAPPHYNADVRQWLTENYPTWIGRGGVVAWPARSPDLNPMDFFVWGFMKSEVYATVVNSEEDLLNRIMVAANTVREKLSFKVTVQAMRKRARACIRENGGHFENII